MKNILTILLVLFALTLFSQTHEVYKFSSKAELEQTLIDNGFEFITPLKMDSQISKDGESINLHYKGNITLNFPKYDSTWVKMTSEMVYCMTARSGEIALPIKNKVTGILRLYYYNYIGTFAGELKPKE